MKRGVVFFVFLASMILVAGGCDVVDNYRLNKAIKELRTLDSVGGNIVGSAASEHPFYSIYTEIKDLPKEKFKTMLKDDHVIVNAMGIYCITKSYGEEEAREILKKFIGDERSFLEFEYGCIGRRTTLGAFLGASLYGDDFLYSERPK